jgi:hypothetical protein
MSPAMPEKQWNQARRPPALTPAGPVAPRHCTGGAEAVVDPDDDDPGRAGGVHGEEGRHPLQGGAVADAGRHGDHGRRAQPGDEARQRALHPGDDDDGFGIRYLVDGGEQAVHPSHSAVAEK